MLQIKDFWFHGASCEIPPHYYVHPKYFQIQQFVTVSKSCFQLGWSDNVGKVVQEGTAVCILKKIPRKSDVVHMYINSLTQTSPKPHSMFLVWADDLKIYKF